MIDCSISYLISSLSQILMKKVNILFTNRKQINSINFKNQIIQYYFLYIKNGKNQQINQQIYQLVKQKQLLSKIQQVDSRYSKGQNTLSYMKKFENERIESQQSSKQFYYIINEQRNIYPQHKDV
ncbi:hypothetical protein ABPG72_016959 [Tetrahymena utriculariae]